MRKTLITLIIDNAPPRPPCFDDDDDWKSWLISAHLGGMRVVRRVDIGKHHDSRRTWHEVLPTKQIDYCSDCTQRRQARMQAAGRCDPCEVSEQEEAAEAVRSTT